MVLLKLRNEAQGARMKQFITWIQSRTDATVQELFNILTEDRSDATITRFAITFLDIWQAIIILNHNYWIPQLVDITLPIQLYTAWACVLALLAVIALVRSDILWLSILVLTANWIMYMILGIASLWYSDPPRASAGFSLFVMFISIAAFWRIMLHLQRDRAIRKRN